MHSLDNEYQVRTGDKIRGFSANIKLTNMNKLFRSTELEGEAMFIT
jgi:hypothetical protein